MIDLNRVFERLAPGVQYRLDSSAPPHALLEWRGQNAPPSQVAIDLCWTQIQEEPAEEEIPSLREIYTRLKEVEGRLEVRAP